MWMYYIFVSICNKVEFYTLFQRLRQVRLEVFTSPARGLGSGVVAQKVIGFGPGSNDSNQNLYPATSVSSIFDHHSMTTLSYRSTATHWYHFSPFITHFISFYQLNSAF